MTNKHEPLRFHLWGWIIPATLLLLTACQARLAASPPRIPSSVALATPTSEPLTVFVPLVARSILADPPRPVAAPVIIPTDPPQPRPTATPRPTPTLAFARPISVPALAPTSDGAARVASVPILMYHYISDPPPGSDRYRLALSVTPANFDAQMSYLQQAGYHTVTLYDLYYYLTQGKPLPEKPIILTFDDGYVDAFTFALPILLKYGLVGTFFVLTGPADRSGAGGYLTWEQIAAMSAAGMDIELHSREHYDLRSRPNDFLVYQIAGGKEAIEAHINRPVRWFAYPSGRYDAAVVRVLKSAGFWGAVTTLPGRTHTAAALFSVPRVRIGGSFTLEAFKQAVTGSK